MSGNQRGRVPAELWFLEQAIVWIETRTSVPKHQIPRQIAPTTMQELYQALKAGVITASGCVDGSERRDISHGEWNDYRLELKYTKFPNHYFTGSGGTPIIAVLSIRSFPAAALRYHGYPSGVWVPSASTQDGDPGYHRVAGGAKAAFGRRTGGGRHFKKAHVRGAPESPSRRTTESSASNRSVANRRN
jgi:hypothetical protein